MSRTMNGGDVIGSGGYGCVFSPQLHCRKASSKYSAATQRRRYVTKLMTNKNAKSEYNMIQTFNRRLRTIPRYADYFLTDGIFKCKVKKLTRKDLKSYTKRCRALGKKNITRRNINSQLNKVSGLMIPHGGITVSDLIDTQVNDFVKMQNLFQGMGKLLKYGILPMNNKRVYHGDIKAGNIMVHGSHTRLIDWGLAFIQSKSKSGTKIHDTASFRPFQFNVPVTCVLFNDTFPSELARFLDAHILTTPSRNAVFEFVKEYVELWNNKRGNGSMDTLNYLFNTVLKTPIPSTNTLPFKKGGDGTSVPADAIVVYITNVVKKCIDDGDIDLSHYYANVYLKNLDVWGTIYSFITLLDLLHLNQPTLNNTEINVYSILSRLFTYTLQCDTQAMDVAKVIDNVNEMGRLYSSDAMSIVGMTMEKDTNSTAPVGMIPSGPGTGTRTGTRGRRSSSRQFTVDNTTRQKYF